VTGVRRKTLVDVSTVDAFQGDEREVIVISTARTEKSSFVDAKERINVAISRAKRHLIFVTNMNALRESDLWCDVFTSAQKVISVHETPLKTGSPF
jgi:superfamily I DNA and/or RNA helicase